MDQPLFTSTHQALRWAFSYHGLSSPKSISDIIARMKDKSRPPSGRGLSGLDGAAQAGMILQEVNRLPEQMRMAVIARFAGTSPCPCCNQPAVSPLRVEAVEHLAEHVRKVASIAGPLALRRGLVRIHYGDKLKMGDIADQCGVHRNTLSNYKAAIRKTLEPIDKHAMAQMDEALSGMVGDVRAAA